jgi:DNA-binding CsgD family transcriptional regulator/tetratricopeptide (TPR) repeat protein
VEARTPAFVGRAGELGQLERALAAAQGGRGAVVLVAGDAGIGKTRLASELARRARDAGFQTLLGRSIDLVGTELPFQPFAEALRPLGDHRLGAGHRPAAGSQLRVFEDTLALLTGSAAAPVLLVLEDLHWADTSTLDLVVYLAHNLADHPVVLLGTLRSDELASAERMRRLADGVRRSGSGFVLDLGPLAPDELTALLATRPASPALTEAIVARSEGNPFFAEELLAAAADSGAVGPVGSDRGGELPRRLRDLLLQRVAQLDLPARDLLRLAAAAGRDVGYPLLRALTARPEPEVRESLRRAVEHDVLVPDQAGGTFRFRHALLAEAIYTTILPGEREELHARLAGELSRAGAASAAELAPHWAAAGRAAEALTASVEAARQAEAVFGLAEAVAHLERALALWPAVPDAAVLTGLDLAGLCEWAAELASQVGASQRAEDLARRAIGLVGGHDPPRAALLHVRLGVYSHANGRQDAGLAAFERAVALAPAEPPSAEGAVALGAFAAGLQLAWRYEESLPVAQQALALARQVGSRAAELRALTNLGSDLAYLGRGDEGLARLTEAVQLAAESGDPTALQRAYVELTDALTMLGRPRESAALAETGLAAMREYGVARPVLVANRIEALFAIGEWDEADRVSAAAVRAITGNYPYMLFLIRADVEIGRGDFEAARAHLEAARATLREDRGLGLYDASRAELALWERRWADAAAAVEVGLVQARAPHAAQIRVLVCAKGLRAQAELTALARARRDAAALRDRLDRARELLAVARQAAADASVITPNGAGWELLARAEHDRARGAAAPQAWAEAAATWDRLQRPPLAAYCRWRQAEALVAAGASRAQAGAPLRDAHAVAARLGAKPLASELELLAQRARLDLARPEAGSPGGKRALEEILGLTPREADVLALIARGYTNREIAAALVISIKTADVHVSHILRKLDAPTRLEAAAIAHRLAPDPLS